jgi:hypothetical protein
MTTWIFEIAYIDLDLEAIHLDDLERTGAIEDYMPTAKER